MSTSCLIFLCSHSTFLTIIYRQARLEATVNIKNYAHNIKIIFENRKDIKTEKSHLLLPTKNHFQSIVESSGFVLSSSSYKNLPYYNKNNSCVPASRSWTNDKGFSGFVVSLHPCAINFALCNIVSVASPWSKLCLT